METDLRMIPEYFDAAKEIGDECVRLYSMASDMEVGDVIQIEEDGSYRIVALDGANQIAYITRHKD